MSAYSGVLRVPFCDGAVSSRHVSLRLTGIEENVTSKHLLTTHKDVKEDIARDVLEFARAVAAGELEIALPPQE